ncbi:MAG: hypothetical protein RMK29_07890 [Myxococcales bacterium]|nr:hypothetical protein [Myxococcota bacterium]MDW8281615.1 hypothetical protein [Myxococcales bacterium]
MAARLYVLLACTFLLLTSREPPWADAHVVYDTTQALIHRGALDVTLPGPPQFFVHRHGRKYGVFPLGNVIAMVPSYLAFLALRHVPGLPQGPLFALTSHLSPALLMAAACLLFFHLCRRRGASPGWAALLAVTLGLCTLCFSYARVAYSEALQTVAMLLVVERTLVAAERPTPRVMAGLGAAAGVLLTSKLVYALLLPVPVLYLAERHILQPRRQGQRPDWPGLVAGSAVGLLCFAPFAAVTLWHNWLKTGSVLDSGYRIQDGIFSGDLLPALYGYTLSTGKSMFLYSPPLVLGLCGLGEGWRRRRAETALLCAMIATVMLFNAKFRHWNGDYCWGPRLLTPITPLVLLLSVPWLPAWVQTRRRQMVLGLVLAAGLGVQLIGASLYWDHYIRILLAVKDQTGAAGWFQDQVGHGHFIPQFSPIRGHLWLLGHLLRGDPDLGRDPPWRLLVPQRVYLRPHGEALRLDLWALDWLPGPGRTAGVLLMVLLGGGALWAGGGLYRRCRSSV